MLHFALLTFALLQTEISLAKWLKNLLHLLEFEDNSSSEKILLLAICLFFLGNKYLVNHSFNYNQDWKVTRYL